MRWAVDVAVTTITFHGVQRDLNCFFFQLSLIAADVDHVTAPALRTTYQTWSTISSKCISLLQWDSMLKRKQSPQAGISPVSVTEQASVANGLLTNARSIRHQLAQESFDANRKLSEAILTVLMYTEKVDSTARLLTLADTCVGKIRARMRALGIPIQPPSDTEITLFPDVKATANHGQPHFSLLPDFHVLMKR
jgi:hypothetical protein